MRARRMELGGYLPTRRTKAAALPVPELSAFDRFLKSSDEREISTTMAFVQILQLLVRDKALGRRIVPIVPDESRTFGMEGMFRQLGIWNQQGQLYTPQDADQLMFYKEDKGGQILQEGINEAGGMCDWIAAATSYSTHGVPMIPFYIFYSMFGFQRIGDLAWAAGDMRSRGFLLGGTAGRTTLNGEGLQHEDGHSHLFSATIPNCISYDPTFGYEVAVVIQDGLRRMLAEQHDVYYYLTVMNENYPQPAMPEGAAASIIKGMYLFRAGEKSPKAPRVQLLGSGTIFREVIAAAAMLKSDWGVESDLWGCPSFTELGRDGMAAARTNMLHPDREARALARRILPQGHDGTGDRGDRLHPRLRRTDPRLRAPALRRAGHRRLRPLGHTGKAAALLRGRSPLRHRRRAEGAGRRGHAARDQGRRGDEALRHRHHQARAVDRVREGNIMSTIEIKVPDIGDFKDVPVIEIFVKAGDLVKADDSLITLESDKATMDVPSPAAGTVKELKVKLGDKLAEGSVVLLLETAEAGTVVPAAPSTAPARGACARRRTRSTRARRRGTGARSSRGTGTAPAVDSEGFKGAHASPSVRKFARELGVDLGRVNGSGPKGRIQQEDVQEFVKQALSGGATPAATAGGAITGGGALNLLPWPSVDFAKFGPIEARPLSRIKKISGANLARNWVMIPHVTQFDEADITDLEAFRVATNKQNEKSGVKLTMLAFLIKACVAALKKFPDFNASLDGDNLVVKQYFHIGFAADTPNGLVVPVLKNADQKGVLQIAKEMGELSAKARDGKLGPADMQGGCFTISSLGGIGGTAFTPIINAPELAILGVSKSTTKPVWDGKAFVPRLMVPLSLSYDHRVIDGASAARFTAYLAGLLADMRRAML